MKVRVLHFLASSHTSHGQSFAGLDFVVNCLSSVAHPSLCDIFGMLRLQVGFCRSGGFSVVRCSVFDLLVVCFLVCFALCCSSFAYLASDAYRHVFGPSLATARLRFLRLRRSWALELRHGARRQGGRAVPETCVVLRPIRVRGPSCPCHRCDRGPCLRVDERRAGRRSETLQSGLPPIEVTLRVHRLRRPDSVS